MKTKHFYRNKLFVMFISLLMCVCSLVLATALPSSMTAYALPSEEFSNGVYFDYQQYAKANNYTYISQNSPEWSDDAQTERVVYVLYRTSKKAYRKELVSVKAKHQQGYATTLAVGASLLTQEETVKTFGVDVEGKIGVVIAKFGGGWKWGDASSRTVTREGAATISKDETSKFVTRSATANVCEYYLYVYKITRTVERDKHDNITGHSNYRRTFDSNLSGKFESFDLTNGVSYSTRKG